MNAFFFEIEKYLLILDAFFWFWQLMSVHFMSISVQFLFEHKMQPKCNQNSVSMLLKWCYNAVKSSQNATKIQSKFSQNAAKIQSKCNQNAVKMQSKFRQFLDCLMTKVSSPSETSLFLYSTPFIIRFENSSAESSRCKMTFKLTFFSILRVGDGKSIFLSINMA